jgi:hypothetical protein
LYVLTAEDAGALIRIEPAFRPAEHQVRPRRCSARASVCAPACRRGRRRFAAPFERLIRDILGLSGSTS